MKLQKLILVTTAVAFAVFGALFGARQMQPAPAVTDFSPTAQLLASTLPDAHGKPQTLSQWRGKTLLINFWAPWCAPCVQEMPELSALQAEMATKNIQFIGIGIDTQSSISEFSTKYQISYPLYVAGMEGTELSEQFGNHSGGLPFTALVGNDGRVIKTYLGRLKMTELRADLATLNK